MGSQSDESNSQINQTKVGKPSKQTKQDETQRTLSQLKEHIVQIEGLIVYLLICIIILYVLDSVTRTNEVQLPVWLIPSAFLIGIGQVMRVKNPSSSVRNALNWGAIVGGVVGAVTGGVTDVLSGGLTGGQGTLIGYGAGAAVGAAAGNWIESWGKSDDLMQRGDAFDYLYKYRNKNPQVANAKLIDEALDTKIPSFDKDRDGRQWYSLDDLNQFLGLKRGFLKRILRIK
jgi:hypothetical protein